MGQHAYDTVDAAPNSGLPPSSQRSHVRRCLNITAGLAATYGAAVVVASFVVPGIFSQSSCVCSQVLDTFHKPCAPFARDESGRCEVPPTPGAFAMGVADIYPSPETVCLITGGTGGIGNATAYGLAQSRRCRTLYVTGRSAASSAAAASALSKQTGHAHVVGMPLDLSHLSAVRKFAQSFVAREKVLGVLILNAGTFGREGGSITKDGFEPTFAITHLGHFLLFQLLCPLLAAAPHPIVVSVSSHSHNDPLFLPGRWGGVEADWLALRQPLQYMPLTGKLGFREYGVAKLAQVLTLTPTLYVS